jgi:hypothetical protein
MEKNKTVYKVLVRKLEENRKLRKLTCRWEYNIKMGIKEIR